MFNNLKLIFCLCMIAYPTLGHGSDPIEVKYNSLTGAVQVSNSDGPFNFQIPANLSTTLYADTVFTIGPSGVLVKDKDAIVLHVNHHFYLVERVGKRSEITSEQPHLNGLKFNHNYTHTSALYIRSLSYVIFLTSHTDPIGWWSSQAGFTNSTEDDENYSDEDAKFLSDVYSKEIDRAYKEQWPYHPIALFEQVIASLKVDPTIWKKIVRPAAKDDSSVYKVSENDLNISIEAMAIVRPRIKNKVEPITVIEIESSISNPHQLLIKTTFSNKKGSKVYQGWAVDTRVGAASSISKPLSKDFQLSALNYVFVGNRLLSPRGKIVNLSCAEALK